MQYLRHITLLFTIVIISLHGVVYAAPPAPVFRSEEASTTTSPSITLFHSRTCPHCRAERAFLKQLQVKYPTLTVEMYEVEDVKNIPLLRAFTKQYGAERELGNVPLTFVGTQYFVGYVDDTTTGAGIEQAVREILTLDSSEVVRPTHIFSVPFLGTLDTSQHSYTFLAIMLGILDGVNVCSLGALVLIIGLALKLQRRRAILLFGGVFLGVTALVYGGMIVLWYQLFETFAAYLLTLKMLVATLSIAGGIYFLHEYLRMRRQGMVCTMQESTLIQRVMDRTSNAFEQKTHIMALVGAVTLFAVVLAIVEFPCSAAVPVVFAGVLADAGMSTGAYIGHISLFVLFYLFDELLIFGIAAYRLKIWMTNGSFTKTAALVEALVLFGIGGWYLFALFTYIP